MKFRKSTIVWLILTLLMSAAAFTDFDSDQTSRWKEATYVHDAKVLSENEGRLVAVSGQPVSLENVINSVTGSEFPSPKVYQYVDEHRYITSEDEWTWDSVDSAVFSNGLELKTECMVGRVGVGEFELDKELTKRLSVTVRDVTKKDFSDNDIAEMKKRGRTESGLKIYYESRDFKNRACWKMWVPDEDDRVTVVGIQKGNTLTYCSVNDVSCENEYMSEADFQNRIKSYESTMKNMPYVFGVLAVGCLVMTIRSLFKKKKDTD